MAANSESISSALPQSTPQILVDTGLLSDHSIQIAECTLCQKALSPDNEVTSDLAPGGLCGDCKFLLLEDFGTPIQSSRRRNRGRFRYSSSESIDNLSRQLPHTARRGQDTVSMEDDQHVDGDTDAWLLQWASTHPTPGGSRRWRQVFSDTDSDGFDNWSSLYGDNESNDNFLRYRASYGENDSFSLSAYGGESDVSMDRHSFVGTGMFNLPDEGDEFDSDTDIDPMNAGLGQWNSDDDEDEEDEGEEGEEEEGEQRDWDVGEAEEAEATNRLQILFASSSSENSGPINWEQQINSPESERILSRRVRDSWQTHYGHNFSNLDETDLPPYGANFGDYLDARQFEELLEHLAENDSSRRGAPPAAVSFVNSLPLVVISKEHEQHEELVCAICKDGLTSGTEANKLPCLHLYHPCCILPWLSARNSCPLCRYELPTDDKDYEEGKRNNGGTNEIREIESLDVMDESSSDVSDGTEANEEDVSSQGGIQQRELVDMGSVINPPVVRSGRGRWFLLAAAPIVSLVGIVLVLWLGNPLTEGSRRLGRCNFPVQNGHQICVNASPNQRENRSRRWWSLF
ncbi:hypothetical protein L6164_002531 [Bauhinia variegata]|uniref:Uncharacterized protein n=1 Tax=Bauhinia variegata TaxID=167791 RepID=A0ACB9PXP6_BAUVA|nr:hypothetical protein L6164_002531 [Bauhinia variegata]